MHLVSRPQLGGYQFHPASLPIWHKAQIMRLSIARSAALGMFLAAAGLTAALAAGPGDTNTGAHPATGQPSAINANGALTPAHPTHVAPSSMTAKECEGMGGKVVYAASCIGMIACARADQNGVVHQACLVRGGT